MILSNTCDYGLRAVCYIASEENRRHVSIREISEKLNISFHFLTKILQILTQHQLLNSFRGPNGGVALARSPDTITLMEIIQAIDGPDLFEKCILGLDNCGNDHPCPLHRQWVGIRENISDLFGRTTLKDVADMVRTNGYRLTNILP
jgi:Rrf2 family protein